MQSSLFRPVVPPHRQAAQMRYIFHKKQSIGAAFVVLHKKKVAFFQIKTKVCEFCRCQCSPFFVLLCRPAKRQLRHRTRLVCRCMPPWQRHTRHTHSAGGVYYLYAQRAYNLRCLYVQQTYNLRCKHKRLRQQDARAPLHHPCATYIRKRAYTLRYKRKRRRQQGARAPLCITPAPAAHRRWQSPSAQRLPLCLAASQPPHACHG